MNSQQLRELFRVHKQLGIPLQHSIGMLFKVKGLGLAAFARQAGYQRTYLYKTLAGELTPSDRLRQAMEEVLGVAPWSE